MYLKCRNTFLKLYFVCMILRGWWIFLFAVLAFHGFYTNLQNRARIYLCSQTSSARLPEAECEEVRSVILQKSLKNITENDFMRYVDDLQRCPWEYNMSEHIRLKSEFKKCCNATHALLVTQDNAPLGHKLRYETKPDKQIVVDDKIYSMLPKNSPFIGKPFETCAVVGNGGILQNSFCGDEIDKTDYVFRFNLPPLTLAEDIGTKSDFVSANPSILITKFGSLYERRRPFIDLVKGYGSAMIVLPAFSYMQHKDVSFRVLHAIEDFDLQNRVAFFHPNYLRNLSSYWQKMGLKVKRMSSGLMLVSAAIELCEKVTLYGFWPFSQDPEGNAVPHHYYDNVPPQPGIHSMPDEFYFYTRMHLKGALNLKVGSCYCRS